MQPITGMRADETNRECGVHARPSRPTPDDEQADPHRIPELIATGENSSTRPAPRRFAPEPCANPRTGGVEWISAAVSFRLGAAGRRPFPVSN